MEQAFALEMLINRTFTLEICNGMKQADDL